MLMKLRIPWPFSLPTAEETSELEEPLSPWTMTLKVWRGFAAAFASRLGGTKAPLSLPVLPVEALPATGTTSIAASASVTQPRFRLPQSAFARTPLRIVRSCRIVETPSTHNSPWAAVERPKARPHGRSEREEVPPPFAVAAGESPHRGNERTRLRIKAGRPQADDLHRSVRVSVRAREGNT